jgi:hypothetical protein
MKNAIHHPPFFGLIVRSGLIAKNPIRKSTIGNREKQSHEKNCPDHSMDSTELPEPWATHPNDKTKTLDIPAHRFP